MWKFDFPRGPGVFSRRLPHFGRSCDLTRDGDFFVDAYPEVPSADYAHTPITTQASIVLSVSTVQKAYPHLNVSQLKSLRVNRSQMSFPDKEIPLPGDHTIRYMTYNPESSKFGYSEKLSELTVFPENEQTPIEADVWGRWTVDPEEFDMLREQANRDEEPVLRQGELRESSGSRP